MCLKFGVPVNEHRQFLCELGILIELLSLIFIETSLVVDCRTLLHEVEAFRVAICDGCRRSQW